MSGPSSSPGVGRPASLLSFEDVDPYPFYEDRRAEGPLVWDEDMAAWLVLGYEECREIETDEARFGNPYVDPSPLIAKVKGGSGNITLTHGDRHAQLRRFHLGLLSPSAVAQLRVSVVKPIVDATIERVADWGRADLARHVADQIPPRVIIALLGMDWRDDDLVENTVHLHEEVMAFIGHNYAKDFEARGLAASAQIDSILRPLIEARRDGMGDDFISRIWREAPSEYGEMDPETALGICREIYLGGTDTTIHAIANAFYLLLSNGDVHAYYRQDPDRAIKPVIEETMRLYGSVQYRYRIANQACTLGGVRVDKDQKLVLVHAAANRDPAKFPCPAQPDFSRRPLTDHLAFNMGPRSCVGAALARAEMAETLRAAFDRLPNLRLDPDAPPPMNRGLFLRSFRPLNAMWD